jgi:tRNA pseudouridine55 synthase
VNKSGIIAVNKPVGWSSFDVIRFLRRVTGIKRIGHAGTLDKEAEGVLVICMGSATKRVESLMDEEKEYIATIKFGERTDTDDSSGRVIEKKSTEGISREKIEKVIESFKGEIEQVPPMYSALKVNGRRLYKLARKGIEIERKPRKVLIKEIEVLRCNPPRCEIRIICGRGTYIRALARDIGEKLECGGYVEKLVRIRVGKFNIKDAIDVTKVTSNK